MANLDLSTGNLKANQITSTVATGTAPFVVTSTTVVSNLNVSALEGHAASYFQTALVSGTSIKTINGASILASGDLTLYKSGDNVSFGTIGCGAITGTSSIQALDTSGFILKGATYSITLKGTTATSSKTITFPNATGTVPLLETANTWTGTNTWSFSNSANWTPSGTALILDNPYNSTDGAPYSPDLIWSGTYNGSLYQVKAFMSPVYGNPTFYMQAKKGSGAWATMLAIDSFGQFQSPLQYNNNDLRENIGMDYNGIRLANASDAVVGYDQFSPNLWMYGKGWNTGDSSSRFENWEIYVAPEGGNPITNVLAFRYGEGWATAGTTLLQLKSDNTVVVSGVAIATYFQTSTAITSNSTGTVAIVAKDAGTATNNAGWLPLKKSDGTTIYVPYWT